jgi:hypothetical protein
MYNVFKLVFIKEKYFKSINLINQFNFMYNNIEILNIQNQKYLYEHV